MSVLVSSVTIKLRSYALEGRIFKKYRRDINIQEIVSFIQMESHAVGM